MNMNNLNEFNISYEEQMRIKSIIMCKNEYNEIDKL